MAGATEGRALSAAFAGAALAGAFFAVAAFLAGTSFVRGAAFFAGATFLAGAFFAVVGAAEARFDAGAGVFGDSSEVAIALRVVPDTPIPKAVTHWKREHDTVRCVKAIRRFTVRTVLPDSLAPLEELAANLRWSWHAETRGLFESIDPELWRASGYDPVRLLGEVSPERLAQLEGDHGFVD